MPTSGIPVQRADAARKRLLGLWAPMPGACLSALLFGGAEASPEGSTVLCFAGPCLSPAPMKHCSAGTRKPPGALCSLWIQPGPAVVTSWVLCISWLPCVAWQDSLAWSLEGGGSPHPRPRPGSRPRATCPAPPSPPAAATQSLCSRLRLCLPLLDNQDQERLARNMCNPGEHRSRGSPVAGSGAAGLPSAA